MKVNKDILSIYEEILTNNKNILSELELVKLNDTNYSNLKYDNDGTQSDSVNKPLLDDIDAAAKAAGLTATVTTASTGHSIKTKTGNTSRHGQQTAVDIAILNGIGAGGASTSSNGNAEFRSLGTKLANALVSMGYVLNTESGNSKAVLWQTNTGGNHFNHLHVSNQETSSSAIQPETSQPDSDNNNNNIETAFIRQLVTPLHGAITKGITEEKVYSKLGNEISSKFGNIIIPSRGNTKIKSPINGVVNNYHSDRHCTNKISIEHSIDDKLYYLQFCNISKPEIRDGKKVSKGDIIGSTSSDVTVSLYDKGLNRLNLPTMLNKEINKKEKSTDKSDSDNNNDENNNNNNNNYDKKEPRKYYDPSLPFFLKKINDMIPSISKNKKGEEPKTKNFFNKYGMSNKKVDENIERIKTLLK